MTDQVAAAVLNGRQVYFLPLHENQALVQVHFDLSRAKHCPGAWSPAGDGGAATRHGCEPTVRLPQRFANVVIRPFVERLDLILLLSASGENTMGTGSIP
jgi:hypothetical protein